MSNYSFIKEVIKEKPINKRKLVLRIGFIIIAAILFGIIAAIVFVHTRSLVEGNIEARKQPDEVDITDETDNVLVTTPLPSVTPVAEVVEVPVPAELGLSEYKKLYQDMKVVSQNAEKSIVTVIGIKSTIDYFDDPYDNRGQLSGVLIANNGRELLVLTEYRVVEDVDKIQVSFHNGRTVDAHYQKHDENTGLTIIRILIEQLDAETLAAITMAPLGNSYKLVQSEPVIALGSPTGASESIAFGAITSVTNKVSSWDTEYSLITTDILGTKGGSGVLLDLDGEIVGIIAQNYSNENNTVTALSISPIKNLLQTLSNNGEIRYLGIKGKEVTEDISNNTGLPEGIYMESPKQDSPAMQAGLMSGDVIVRVNDEEVRTIAEYRKQLDVCTVGQPVKLTVMRKGATEYQEIVFDVMVEAL